MPASKTITMKTYLYSLYQITFNFFGKKRGVNNFTHAVASTFVGLIIFFVFVDITSIIKLIFHEHWSRKDNRAIVNLLLFLFMGFIYFLLFNILKFEKKGSEENGFFVLDKDISKHTHYILYAILSITVFLIFYYSFFF